MKLVCFEINVIGPTFSKLGDLIMSVVCIIKHVKLTRLILSFELHSVPYASFFCFFLTCKLLLLCHFQIALFFIFCLSLSFTSIHVTSEAKQNAKVLSHLQSSQSEKKMKWGQKYRKWSYAQRKWKGSSYKAISNFCFPPNREHFTRMNNLQKNIQYNNYLIKLLN